MIGELFSDYTLRTVTLGSATLGAVSGAVGTFAVLRRQSLLGDAISHSALPGIALAFLLTGSKATLTLVLGAAISGWLGTLFALAVVRRTRVSEDSALGIVLSVFFGFGLVLLTLVQRLPTASQAGLEKFLFGQAATLVTRDVVVIAALGAVAVLAIVVFWKEFKLVSFDPEFGGSLGFPMARIEMLLTAFLVIAIVIGLQAVGVVLMSAMVVAPAAAARQWTDNLRNVVVLAAVMGGLAGVTGTLISASTTKLPTGPTIVLSATALVVLSLAFAPNRGLLWAALRRRRNRRRIRAEAVLLDLYALSRQHTDPLYAHPEGSLEAMGQDRDVPWSLEVLADLGLVAQRGPAEWALTPDGTLHAEELLGLRASRSLAEA
ncbi:MAG: iron chelate uptake ABC transporter family permease subunit [Acidobacteriota bacterium]